MDPTQSPDLESASTSPSSQGLTPPAAANRLFEHYQLTRLQKTVGTLGGLLAIVAVYYDYNLAADFADSIVSEEVSEEEWQKILVELAFAIPASLPSAALLGLPVRDYCIGLASPHKNQNYQPPVAHAWAMGLLQADTEFMALLSSIPFIYQLAGQAVGKIPLQVLFGMASLLACYVTSKLGTEAFYLQHFNKHFSLEEAEIKSLREELVAAIDILIEKLYVLNSVPKLATLTALYNRQREGVVSLDFFRDFSAVLADEPEPPRPRPYSLYERALINLVKMVGVGLGSAAAYTTAFLVIEAVEWFCDQVGLQNKRARLFLQYFFAIKATLPICLFLGDFAKTRCDDYLAKALRPSHRINPQTSHPNLRGFVNGTSLLSGAFAAVPNAKLSIEEGDSVVGLVFASLGLMLAQAKAIDLLIQEIIDAYDRRHLPEAKATLRDDLIRFLNFVRTELAFAFSPDELQVLRATMLRTLELPARSPSPLRLTNLFPLLNPSLNLGPAEHVQLSRKRL